MEKNNSRKDGLIFSSESNPNEMIVVNFHSWTEIIKGIMIFYGKKTEQEAQAIIDSAPLFTIPPKNYAEACMLGHEDEYYWAMVMSHGDRYYEKGFSRNTPHDYFDWELEYIKKHNLEEKTLIFSPS